MEKIKDFNPRSHERSDEIDFLLILLDDISIHAPTRGATFVCLNLRHLTAISIHAPTRGATFNSFAVCVTEIISIHAPTRGATSLSFRLLSHLRYFNPRSHERSDKAIRRRYRPECISIHAPTRGATRQVTRTSQHFKISIHAPTRGATLLQFPCFRLYLISIHAPTRGATHFLHLFNIKPVFQSTLPREERQ